MADNDGSAEARILVMLAQRKKPSAIESSKSSYAAPL